MTGKALPRGIEFDQTSEIATTIMMIFSILLRKADGILVFTGEEENERVYHGIRLWEKERESFLLITGDPPGKIWRKKDIAHLCCVNEDYPGIFIGGEDVRNTLDQAVWAAELIAELEIESLIVISALYHLPRVFLTLLKTFQKNDQEIILIPSPTLPVSLKYNYLRIPAEIARIIRYQEMGDVATLQELYEHLQRQLTGQS